MVQWQPLTDHGLSAKFFISYRSLDADVAAALEAELARLGQQVWRDRRNIYSGDDWRAQIVAAIDDCDDVVVYLTPAAADSGEVAFEIETAMARGKRLHLFPTFDVRAHALYSLIQSISFTPLEGPPDPRAIAATILAPQLKRHPLDQADFERRYAHQLLPPAGWDGLETDHLRRYAGYQSGPETSALLATNYAMIYAALGDWPRCQQLLSRACKIDGSGLPRYYLALAYLEGRRPAHAPASTLDAAAKAIDAAWAVHKAPLIIVAYTLINWDSGRVRGPKLGNMLVKALETLPQFPQDRPEIDRLLQLAPWRKSPIMPLETPALVRYLSGVVQGG